MELRVVLCSNSSNNPLIINNWVLMEVVKEFEAFLRFLIEGLVC